MGKLNSSIILVGLLSLVMTGCSVGRMMIYTFSDIKDYKRFPYRELKREGEPFKFFETDSTWRASNPIRVSTNYGTFTKLDDYLPKTKTVAFLVIRNDSILYENYFNGYDTASIVPSFSMAKSYTSALFGIAMAEGKINSVEDSLTQYIPELQGKGLDQVKLKHVLKMTSGIRSQENYHSPFSGVAAMYYGTNLRKQASKTKPEDRPGVAFEYKSMNTQLLGMVIENATGRSLTQYLQEKIWSKIGAEYDATWSIDRKKEGIEKAFCCLNARARDFAKFGRLYLNMGNWEGEQIIPEEWVKESTKVDSKDGATTYYQYQWWLPSKEGDYSAQGHLGQFIYVHPEKQLIIVRLGKSEGDVDWSNLFREIAKKGTQAS